MILTKIKSSAFEEMDLQKTLNSIEDFCCYLVSQIEILKDLEVEYSKEVSELLSKETLERYKSNAKVLKFPYNNFKLQRESLDLEEGFLVQSWSNLGSLLESTLQIFLAFYYRDYITNRGNIWDDNVIQKLNNMLKKEFNENLKKLVEDSDINFSGKDRKSLMKKIDEIIKDKKNLPMIDKLTLEPLIAFYTSNKIFNSNEYSEEEFRRIRDYRNAIHSFQKREIGSWDELNYYSKVLLMLLIDMNYRLPSLPDEIPLTEEIYDKQIELVMLEQQWFEYTLKGVN